MRTHGKRATYIHDHCRCDECCQANTAYCRARKSGKVPPNGAHGLSGYNNYNCRCDVCTGAKRAANATYWAAHSRAS